MISAIDSTIADFARALDKGEYSAEAIVEAALARVEDYDVAIHSFVEVFAVGAVKAARAVDRQVAAGVSPGPLAGVPVAHKDIFYRRDRAPSCGVKNSRGLPVLPASPVPDRLAAAGAVELGALNLSAFCFGATGANEAYGDVCNPWDPTRVTGGSSSGSAAAVAAGLVRASLGTDSGGSVRAPAALCGVVGLKPTHGVLPTTGLFPMTFSLDCVGVLTRSIADCAAIFSVAVGRTVAPLAPYPLRVGVPRNFYLEGLDSPVAAAFEAGCRELARSGAALIDVSVPEDEEMRSLLRLIMRSEGVAIHAGLMTERPENYSREVRRFLESGLGVSARDYIDALRLRDRFLVRSMREVFDRVDVLLTPTTPIVAPSHAKVADVDSEQAWRTITLLTRCTQPASYMGLPALSVPFGADDGHLPIGIQLIAAPHREDALFGVANLLEAAAPRRLPPLDNLLRAPSKNQKGRN